LINRENEIRFWFVVSDFLVFGAAAETDSMGAVLSTPCSQFKTGNSLIQNKIKALENGL
jgi:hypothetical protein